MLNLGTLQFGLAIDTRALSAARNRIEEFGRSVQATQRAANRGADTQIAAFRKQENAILSGLEKLKQASASINRMNITPQMKTDMLTQAGRMYNDLTKQIGQAGRAADATKFDRSVAAYRQGINDLVRGAQQMSSSAASASRTAESAAIRQANAYAKAEERVRNLNAAIERSGLNTDKKTSLTGGGDAALSSLRQAMSGGVMSTRAYNDAMNQFNATLGSARRNFQDATAKTNSLTASQENLRKTLQGVGSSFLVMNGHLGGMSTRLFALSHITANLGVTAGIAAGGVTGLGLAAFGLTRGAIQTTIELEKAEKALTAVHGSSLMAQAGMEYVRSVADQAGIAFSGAASSYSRYVAGANAANQSLDETQRQFRTVALAAGTLGLSVEDTQGVFRALEQILSKGKVQSEELRGQLGDRLPGAFAIAATAVGKTTDELSDMMKKGEVLSAGFVPKFVSALQQAYNIDVSANIDTTQAAIQRLDTAVTFMYDSFAKSTGVVGTFKMMVNGLAEIVNFLATNMDSLVNAAIGLTGAIMGAVAAFTALYVIQGMITAFAALSAAIAAVTTVMGALSAAATVLNAVLSVSVIGAILRIGVVLGGAYLGFKTLTDMVKQNAAQLGDTSQADIFIQSQLRMRTATDETTKSIIRQQLAQLNAARSAQAEAMATLRGTQQSRNAALNPKTIWGGNARITDTERAFVDAKYDPKLREQATALQQTTGAVERQTRAVNGLMQVLNTPIAPQGAGAKLFGEGSGKGKTPKGEQPNIDSILSVIDAYKAAQEKLAALANARGPQDLQLIDDLLKAKDQLRSLSDKELGMVADAMNKAGLSTGNLVQDLAKLNTAIRKSEEQARVFTQAWNNIDREMIDLEGIDRITSFLEQGGSPDKIYLVEALTAAKDALRKLDDAQLEAIRQKLASVGFNGRTAAEALAQLFAAGDKGKQLNDTLANIATSMEDANRRIREAAVLQAAYAKGANVGQAMEKILDNKRAVDAYRKALLAAGLTAAEAEVKVQGLYDALSQADRMDAATEKMRKQAEQWKELWQNFKDDAVNSIWEVIEGTKSLSAAITDLFMNFVENATKDALGNLFDGVLTSLGLGDKSSDSQQEALQSNTTSIDLLTASVDQLKMSIDAMAIGGVGGEGGGKGSSFINGLLGIGKKFLPGLIGKRAFGGHVTGGMPYEVSEQGTGGELFIPGQSGTMVPLSKAASSGGGAGGYIDARTTIDARGASREAIAELEQKMAMREQRLKALIPSMIDNRVEENRWRGRDKTMRY